jgi:hypothetical protein
VQDRRTTGSLSTASAKKSRPVRSPIRIGSATSRRHRRRSAFCCSRRRRRPPRRLLASRTLAPARESAPTGCSHPEVRGYLFIDLIKVLKPNSLQMSTLPLI